ncbi:CARDB domain-containing protein [Mastigocoleus testarum]|uniref:CARDB domain-containing protein n=1 Tax=Mastigocoleus testarum BC008 TaxID=371196 RepID=A0A0V7ZYE6_9CYAN|nr:CARDB domain-containing protein [Mastigocoleus testarum]KST61824.1 hypothetical protein BC008_07200 [Mastigocoleus testarum BC008]KST69613.1 hypothetical protein BC008_04740 [Mastigocoleus testarum BC008]
MNFQKIIAAPIALGLIIGNFPLLAADTKNVNISASNTFSQVVEAPESKENPASKQPQDEESSTENQTSEQTQTEESSTKNQTSEQTQTEETSDNETTVEEPAEEIEKSQPSEKCLNGGEHINIGGIISISNCHKLKNSDSFTQPNRKPIRRRRKKPDLVIRKVRFSKARAKVIRVLVSNIGNAPAKSNILKLTIRSIKGKNVRRTIKVIAPRLKKKQSKWIVIRAKKLLPKKVKIQNTKFRLFIDAGKVIREKNEKNNIYWHKH